MSLVDLGKRLLEAAKQGLTEEVRTLMSNGAPFTTDWLGTSPLHFAAQNGHVSTAEILLRAGISRDARTKVDRTPLHVAAQEGHADVVNLLLQNGADIEAKDMLKMTPLHWAVEKGHLHVMELLLHQNADINCENKFDKTPVEIAISNGRNDIVEMLQMSGQNVVEVTTSEDQMPIVEEVPETVIMADASDPQAYMTAEPVTLVTNIKTEQTNPESPPVADDGGLESEQSSTAVLATLAALAEAKGPLSASSTSTGATAAEALNWLETHGITMISSNDAPTIVSSSLDGNHTLTLTEAGKLALNFVKGQDGTDTVLVDGQSQDLETTEEVVTQTVETIETVDDADAQRVITIVTDQQGVPISTSTESVLTMDGTTVVSGEIEELEEPALKRVKLENDEDSTEDQLIVEAGEEEQDDLRRQLELVQKQADEFKEQLKKKEQEAAGYKKQLTQMGTKGTP